MITKRIIPCLDVDRGRVVKGVRFADLVDVADPVTLAQRYSDEGADEVVFYDISATAEGRRIFLDTVEQTAAVLRVPLTVGGGVSSVGDVRDLLLAGADKVSVNSGAVRRPELIADAASRFGTQCVTLSVDVARTADDRWEVVTHGGRQPAHLDALEWVARGVDLGAGEVVLNAIDTDGVRAGYDVELTRSVRDAVAVPVVASGGAGSMAHFLSVLTDGRADAALAASVFHYGELAIPELKRWLASHGVPVREV